MYWQNIAPTVRRILAKAKVDINFHDISKVFAKAVRVPISEVYHKKIICVNRTSPDRSSDSQVFKKNM